MKKLALAITVALASNAAVAIDDLSGYINSEFPDKHNNAVVQTSNTLFGTIKISQLSDDTAVVDLKNTIGYSADVSQSGEKNKALVKSSGYSAYSKTVINQSGDENEASVKSSGASSLNDVAIRQGVTAASNNDERAGRLNKAEVELISSDSNRVIISQDFMNDADVYVQDSDLNQVTISQTAMNREVNPSLNAGARVKLTDMSDSNRITIVQSSYNEADASLKGSSGNIVNVEQYYGNKANLNMKWSNGNVISVDQDSGFGTIKNDTDVRMNNSDSNSVTVMQKSELNKADIDMDFSSRNAIDISQTDESNLAKVDLDYSNANWIDINQVGTASVADVKLTSSHGNFFANSDGTMGVTIQQASNDYARVHMTNSVHNAVSINQQ